jgi:hypothetical protein
MDTCLFYANHAYRIAIENHLYAHAAIAAQFLTDFYKEMDLAAALYYSNMVSNYKDSLSDLSTVLYHQTYRAGNGIGIEFEL